MKPPHRIGIMGSAGSGKTTLARVLGGTLQIHYVAEGVREWLAERGLNETKRLPWDLQLELQEYFVANKMLNESLHQAFVSDRTTIDGIVSLELRRIFCQDLAEIPMGFVNHALEYARRAYNRIVLLRWNGTPRPAPDGIRETDPCLLQKEYELCWSWCNSLGLKTTIVPALPDSKEIDILVNGLQSLPGLE